MEKLDWLTRGICQHVRERRVALGMSQEELSKRSGLHRTYISDMERGERNLSLKNLQRLAEALETCPSQMVMLVEQHRPTAAAGDSKD